MSKDQTLEINAAHPIVVNLNQLRKQNKVAASLVAKQFLDNVLVQSGIPFDLTQGTDRQFKLIASYLELCVNQSPSAATRASEADPTEVIIEADEPKVRQSAYKQAKDNMRKGSDGPKVTLEHTFSEEDFRQKR